MAEVRERRQHQRVEITLPVTVERLGSRSVAASGSTIDLGEGGACLVAPARFAVGDVVELSLGSGELSVRHRGLVVGQQEHAGTATLNIAFRTPDDDVRTRLRGLIELD
jgi:hypothetical protein